MSKANLGLKSQKRLLPKERLKLCNEDIAEYLKSKVFKEWRGNTEDDLQEIVAKMNSVVNKKKENDKRIE